MTTEERLEKLERELGRERRRNCRVLASVLVITVLGAAAVVVLMTGGTPTAFAQARGTVYNVLRARRFVLVDRRGKERAWLKVDVDKGGPALELLDRKGKVRWAFGASRATTKPFAGPFLAGVPTKPHKAVHANSFVLEDQRGNIYATLAMSNNRKVGGPELTLRNGKASAR